MRKIGLIISVLISIFFIFLVDFFNDFVLLFLIFSFIFIIGFNVKALIEKDLNKYLFFGFLVQASYVLLDSSVSVLSDKISFLGFFQLINYIIPSILLLMVIKGNNFNKLKVNNIILLGILISVLSLSGLPGFNLFVSEFFIYSFAFEINAFLLVLCFICSILTLLNYLRILSNVCFSSVKIKSNKGYKLIVSLLILVCIILGVFPWIQTIFIEGLL